jgi:hypothetical protein
LNGRLYSAEASATVQVFEELVFEELVFEELGLRRSERDTDDVPSRGFSS